MKRVPSLVRESVAVSIFLNQTPGVLESFQTIFGYRVPLLGFGVLLRLLFSSLSDIASMVESCPAVRVHRINVGAAIF